MKYNKLKQNCHIEVRQGNRKKKNPREGTTLICTLRNSIKSTKLEAMIYTQKTWDRAVPAVPVSMHSGSYTLSASSSMGFPELKF